MHQISVSDRSMHCLVSDFAASTKHGDYENIPGSYAVSDPKDKSRLRLMYVTERDNATLRFRAGTTDATGRLPTTTVHAYYNGTKGMLLPFPAAMDCIPSFITVPT